MCLYTKQICPRMARKDIVCYKVFGAPVGKNYMLTPYQRKCVPKPTENNPTLMDDTDVDIDKTGFITPKRLPYGGKIDEFGRIGRGMIHAYTYPRRTIEPYVLYKCIIPKGTLYYKGITKDICAKKMLIVEEV